MFRLDQGREVEERGAPRKWVCSCRARLSGPDMVAGVDAERQYVLLEVAQLDSWFAEFVQSL